MQTLAENNIQVVCLQEVRKAKQDMPVFPGFALVSWGYSRDEVEDTINQNRNLTKKHKVSPKILVAIYVDVKLVAVKADYVLKRIHRSASCSAEVYVGEQIYHFTSVYYHPSATAHIDGSQLNKFKELTDGKKYILTGDFNVHDEMWSNLPHASSNTNLAESIDGSPLVVLNDGSTTRPGNSQQRPSAIDLTLVSASIGHSHWEVVPEFTNSDHFVLVGSIPVGSIIQTASTRPKFNFDKADWAQFQRKLDQPLPTDFENRDPNEQYKYIQEIVLNVAKEQFPMVKVRSDHKPNSWWNEACDLAKQNLGVRSRIYYEFNTADNEREWSNAKELYSLTIARAKLAHWEQTLQNEVVDYRDSSILWRKIKAIRRSHASGRKPLKTVVNGRTVTATSDKEKAKLLAETISHKSRKESLSEEQRRFRDEFEKNYEDPAPNNNLDFNKPITTFEFEDALNKINNKKSATGPDLLSYTLIAHLPPQIKKLILDHFNTCLQTGNMPDAWKHAEVFTILRDGKPSTDPESYRPISLTPHTGKLFERIINTRLEHYLELNNKLPNLQTGFRRGRSTTDNLVYITERMKEALRERRVGRHFTYFDVKRAFDRVWHTKLLSKLANLGISGNIYNVIKSFLTKRTMCVRVGDEVSANKELHMGAPQGAVLSPLLFIVMLHDIEKEVELHGNSILLYADDIALVSEKVGLEKCQGKGRKPNTDNLSKHQKAIDSLCLYMEDNGFEFSAHKTQFQTVTRFVKARNKATITVNGIEVEHKDNIKYLGLTLNYKLDWKSHFAEVKKKARRHMNLLKILASKPWARGSKFLVNVAQSLVRSVVSYGQECFFSSPDCKILTGLEIQALKIALGVLPNTGSSGNRIYREAGWLTLEENRRLRCSQYVVRTCNIANHINKGVLEDDGLDKNIRLKAFLMKGGGRPWAGDVASLSSFTKPVLEKAGVTRKKIETFVLDSVPPSCRQEINCHFTLDPGQKKSDDLNAAGATANLYIDKHFGDFFQAYTDGSVQKDGRTGVGVVFRRPGDRNYFEEEFCCRISDGHCTMTAELIGILLALNGIDRFSTYPKNVILTDSLSAIQALQSTPKNCYSAQNGIKQMIAKLGRAGKTVHLCHVPSHTTVHGNNQADLVANQATVKNTIEVNTRHTRKEAYRLIINSCREDKINFKDWEERHRNKKTKGVFPRAPTQTIILYRRVKLGMPLFRFYNFCTDFEIKCPHCHDDFCLEHVFEYPCDTLEKEFLEIGTLLKNENISFSDMIARDRGDHLNLAISCCNFLANSTIGYLL